MKFMALGGIHRTGASCYYLELAGQKLLLDCGRQGYGQRAICPDFDALFRNEMLSLSELNGILISHGHCDHVGMLPELRPWELGVPVYTTGITRSLMGSLLVDRLTYQVDRDAGRQLQQLLQSERTIQFLTPVTYGVPFVLGQVTVTYYPAGHVPGAAMIYLESPEGNVLYTGDFRMEGTQLTDGLLLPNTIRPDTVILCGMHARHPNYRPVNTLEMYKENIHYCVHQSNLVHIRVSQLTKGLEAAHWAAHEFPQTKIYLDQDTWNLGERLEECAMQSMAPNFYHKLQSAKLKEGIIIDGCPRLQSENYFSLNISLHATYPDCVSLLEKLHPKNVFLVHSPPDAYHKYGDTALEQQFFPQCRIISPTQGQLFSNTSNA